MLRGKCNLRTGRCYSWVWSTVGWMCIQVDNSLLVLSSFRNQNQNDTVLIRVLRPSVDVNLLGNNSAIIIRLRETARTFRAPAEERLRFHQYEPPSMQVQSVNGSTGNCSCCMRVSRVVLSSVVNSLSSLLSLSW